MKQDKGLDRLWDEHMQEAGGLSPLAPSAARPASAALSDQGVQRSASISGPIGGRADGRSAQDHAVWRALVGAVVIEHTIDWSPQGHVRRLRALVADGEEIPSLEAINAWLRPTGWRAQYVEGYVPGEAYQAMLCDQVFPVARGLRRMRDFDHSAAPDFAHDVLGHLPMLFEPGYRNLLRAWGRRAATTKPHPADDALADAMGGLIVAKERERRDEREIALCTDALIVAHKRATAVSSRCFQFETFFTWAMEFGLLRGTGGPPTVIGGACLSSPGEMARLKAGAVHFRPFEEAVAHPVDYTVYQPIMFVAPRYGDLAAILASI